AQCKKLAAAKALGEQVEGPLHPTIILALVCKLLPEQVALTKLSVEMVPVRETPPGAKPEGSEVKTVQVEKPIHLELSGIAKSDGDVARCLNRLSEHPMFANVKLAKSQLALDGGPHRVAFQIVLEIPVQRRFVIANKEGI